VEDGRGALPLPLPCKSTSDSSIIGIFGLGSSARSSCRVVLLLIPKALLDLVDRKLDLPYNFLFFLQ
jgi:hypothetical protein